MLGLLVGLVCGVVNCPIASVLLSMELFGGAGLPSSRWYAP